MKVQDLIFLLYRLPDFYYVEPSGLSMLKVFDENWVYQGYIDVLEGVFEPHV